ncbi:MAG TPA: amidase, partial [Lachnospiraceae bacterium]|nr:amidase [Lachnospiraceae bacterium]
MKVLLVIDMQNDFIDGALGTKEAVAIVPNVIKKIKEFDGVVYATRDTHEENYLDTQEGKNLPVKHCVRG